MKGAGEVSFYGNLFGPFSGLLNSVLISLRPRVHVCLLGLSRPCWVLRHRFWSRHCGAEETNTSQCLNQKLCLQNNQQSRGAHMQQDVRWMLTMCTADGRVTAVFQGKFVGCFGFLILYILALENARNLLAEQVYLLCFLTRLFSTEVCFWKIPSADFAAKAAHSSVGQFKTETYPL